MKRYEHLREDRIKLHDIHVPTLEERRKQLELIARFLEMLKHLGVLYDFEIQVNWAFTYDLKVWR